MSGITKLCSTPSLVQLTFSLLSGEIQPEIYVVVFLDYLMKWVEAFPVTDQRAETVARLLVEEVICHHGAPERLLSDRGANFLSDLWQKCVASWR